MEVSVLKGPLGRPRKYVPKGSDRNLQLTFRPTVYQVVETMASGAAREIAVFGTRGDGKTIGVLGGMLAHAGEHRRLGFPYPVKWLGVTDTFSSHKAKTFESLVKNFWKGCWKEADGGHIWRASVNGQVVVELHLFGIEDQGAMDRVRTECHGVWFEEPAPTAVMVSSSGVTEMAWGMAMTSQRLPTHAHVAVMSLNYPDEDHWTWQRFQPGPGVTGHHPSDTTRRWFRIPPGERADAAQRQEWANALRDRPDLLRRLIEGQPGSIVMGAQVAEGFREDLHIAKERLHPIPGEPLFLGQDFGHSPTCLIGQAYRGQLRIYAALTMEKAGVAQLVEYELLPWLHAHAPWTLQQGSTMLRGCYDPAGQTGEQTDIETNPICVIERKIGGLWWPGPVTWEARRNCLLTAINRHAGPGRPALQIDPTCRVLIQALSGRWYYPTDRLGAIRRDLPRKPNHPYEDLGDALIYLLWGMLGESQPMQDRDRVKVETRFTVGIPREVSVISTW